MQITSHDAIKAELRRNADAINSALDARLRRCTGTPPSLLTAMRYSLEAGGKRLRPALVLWCAALCKGKPETALPAALAVECVHTFSLIHDDLPAIDNDDLRRGRPTSHKQFGEALAILAGDALLTLAFEILACDVADAEMSRELSKELASATGSAGLIGGEVADIEGERMPPSAGLVAEIHAAKTARLIQASCRLGAIAARAKPDVLAAVGEYGHRLGMAFQASDDLLDVLGSGAIMGKAVQKDGTAGKQTYPRAVGVEESRRLAEAAARSAVDAIRPLGPEARLLEDLACFVIEREA
ncbi:MAG: polyprenyl synthetase family protein [Planctomycetes bacterium]|nr:polyprenyl synthetase family protein [Planctomycetota bacterium]